MNTATLAQTPLPLQLSYVEWVEAMTNLQRKLDGLAIVTAALLDRGISPTGEPSPLLPRWPWWTTFDNRRLG